MLSHESDKTMAEVETAESRLQRGKTGSANRRGASRRTAIMIAAFFCAGFAVLIFSGIRSRMAAEKSLEQKVRSNAIPLVAVIHPKAGSTAQQIKLPGTTEAFTEAPIYARTSGYLKQWFFDIGVRVKRGQLLAEIETPELDQQLQQAVSELRTAQANLYLARVTAERWVTLLNVELLSQGKRLIKP